MLGGKSQIFMLPSGCIQIKNALREKFLVQFLGRMCVRHLLSGFQVKLWELTGLDTHFPP